MCIVSLGLAVPIFVAQAPYYDPSAGQSDLPRQRLAPHYHLNAMLFYERMSWDLVAEPRYLSMNSTVPAHALAFATLKVWCGVSCVLLFDCLDLEFLASCTRLAFPVSCSPVGKLWSCVGFVWVP